MVLAAFGPSSLASVAALADGWSFTGRPEESAEDAAARFGALGRQLDDLCHAEGRDPREVTRGYGAGFAGEVAFSSVDAFDDVTGRLVDAGADEIVYYYMSDAQDDFRAARPRWVDRSMLERLIGDGRWAVLG
jgi:alkanesulfonate monooxygenase SsuD/methylene tetrahydromethanopterin reductase-like flavin-dependent oxidoreductase (luciferase family)